MIRTMMVYMMHIWASDALYYNSGAVTHSSAYNYRANKMAAFLASLIGEDPSPYQNEAEQILKAMNKRLWMQGKGCWAEYQDFMGHRRLHESPGLWTIYHALDSDVADPFQAGFRRGDAYSLGLFPGRTSGGSISIDEKFISGWYVLR